MQKNTCPPIDLLKKLCLDSLPSEQETLIIAHLDTCEKCCDRIDEIGGSRLLGTHKALAQSVDFADEPSANLLGVMSQLKALSKSHTGTKFDDLSSWIEPSESGLGRVAHYQLTDFIGRGGMGIVFKARDTKLDRDVAVKFMTPSLLVDDLATERFFREARSAAKINHPNVVTVHAVERAKNLPYLVMEFVQGETLDEALGQNGQLTMERVIEIASQLTAGLSAAHGEGIIHRDVKPANILIMDQSGQVKLADFGLAHRFGASSLTQSGMMVGTPEFTSPEQCEPDLNQVDHRADLFSLGSVLYYLCCGRVPFVGKSVLAKIESVCRSTPVPLESLNPETPAWLVDLINRLHQKNPSERLQSASETLQMIRQRRSPDSRASNLGKRSRRIPSIWLIAAIVLVVGSVGAFMLMHDRSSLENAGIASDVDEFLALLNDKEIETIEIDAPELVFSEGFRVEDRSLQIFASEDIRPTLRFQINSELAPVSVIDGELTIGGVNLKRIDSGIPGESDLDQSLIYCDGANLNLNGCKLSSRAMGACVLLDGNDECIIRNSELNAAGETAIAWIPHAESKLQLSNTFVLGATGIDVQESSGAILEIDHCTFLGMSAISLNLGEAGEDPLRVTAEASVFVEEESTIIGITDDWDDEFAVDDWLVWRGRDNLMPKMVFVVVDEDRDEQVVTWDLGDWRDSETIDEIDSQEQPETWNAQRESILQKLENGEFSAKGFRFLETDRGAKRVD